MEDHNLSKQEMVALESCPEILMKIAAEIGAAKKITNLRNIGLSPTLSLAFTVSELPK